MKMLFIVLGCIILSPVFSQEGHLCSSHRLEVDANERTLKEYSSFSVNSDFSLVVDSLMTLAGFKTNYIVINQPGYNNAAAFCDSLGHRYIKYDNQFLGKLNSDSTRFESIVVLAHEIGHHLAGHTLNFEKDVLYDPCIYYCAKKSKYYNKFKCETECVNYLDKSRKDELEADRFAGFIMQKYGAEYSYLENSYKKFTSNYNDTLSTHPSLDIRLIALRQGYNLAQKSNVSFVSIHQIKGSQIRFKNFNLDVTKRNRLIDKIQSHIHDKPLTELSLLTQLRISGGSSQNMEEQVSSDTLMIRAFSPRLMLTDYDRIKFDTKIKIEVSSNILSVYIVKPSQKLMYRSEFEEDEIDFRSLQFYFFEFYRKSVERMIEEYAKG